MLVFWRLLQGFGLGGNLAVDFSLFMEFVPTNSRGKSSTLLTVFATFGSMTAALLAWLLVDPVTGTGWRPFLLLAAAPGVVIAALRARMLESPHFLASCGRLREAEQVLRSVADYNRAHLPAALSLHEQPLQKQPPLSRVIQRLTRGHLRRRMAAASLLWFALSFAFYGFSVWGPSYFEARGFSPQRSYAALFSSVACQIPGTMAAAVLVERVGRRPLLVVFALGCCASLSGFALAAQSEAAMVACSLVLNFNTAALWAVTYTFTPEIFPTALRTSAMGVCSAIARVSGILTSFLGCRHLAPLASCALTFVTCVCACARASARARSACLCARVYVWVCALAMGDGRWWSSDACVAAWCIAWPCLVVGSPRQSAAAD